MDYRAQGLLNVKLDSDLLKAKGSFTYNLGKPKREAIVGVDGVHGYTERPQIPFVEGEITIDGKFDLKKFLDITDATLTLELRNGKVVTFSKAWINTEGTVEVEEGKLAVRFESEVPGEEIK